MSPGKPVGRADRPYCAKPNPGSPNTEAGLPRLAWFKKLNASARRLIRAVSRHAGMGKERPTERSTLNSPGPLKAFRPRLPIGVTGSRNAFACRTCLPPEIDFSELPD